MPKTWDEIAQQKYNRRLIAAEIKWDGDKTSDSIEVPFGNMRPVLIAVDNQTPSALTATLEYLVTYNDGNAQAVISEEDGGAVTVTVAEAGKEGNDYSIAVVLPEDPEAATDLAVDLVGSVIVITLAVKEDGEEFIPDDTKNTATLIAAAITNDLEGFTAEVTTAGKFTKEIAPVQFTGGLVPVWGELVDADGDAIGFDVATASEGEGEDEIEAATACFGPVEAWPRFYGGRLTLSASGTPPDEDTITRVFVQQT